MIWLLVAPPAVLLLGAMWLARGLVGLRPMVGDHDDGALRRAHTARVGLAEALDGFATRSRDDVADDGDR